MDLERVAAVIRPRSPWEAIDLGFGMVRAWWRPLGAAWLAIVAPAWWLAFLPFLLFGRPGLGLFAAWWLRPVFDRVPLFVVSRALFGDAPSPRQVLAALPRLWLRDLWAGLLAQRLDTARSFDLPVGQLEGLRGTARRQRIALLRREGRTHAVWLTAGCSLLEMAAVAALLQLLWMLTPQPSNLYSDAVRAFFDGEAGRGLWLAAAALSWAAFLLVEPFYVAAGFSLYLSRRTRLEGWDVEIAFRRLAGRLTAPREGERRTRVRTAVSILLLGTALTSLPVPARAAGPPETPAHAIHEILAGRELRTRETVTRWQLRHPLQCRPRSPHASARWRLALPAALLRAIAYALGAALIALLALLLVRGLRGWSWRGGRRDAAGPRLPDAVFGLDVRPESLPADVPGAAWAAWQRGEGTAALALLYRGALAGLIRRDGLEIEPSWTEGDCLAAVRRGAGRERADCFARLTAAWQSAAYAHRLPAGEEVERLCAGWRRSFGAAGAAGAAGEAGVAA